MFGNQIVGFLEEKVLFMKVLLEYLLQLSVS